MEAKKKTAFISGNFNILHPGHLRLFQFAKENADTLIVAVTENSAPGVTITQSLRAEALLGLKLVDKVLKITDGLETTIRQIAPDIIIKGKEFASQKNLEDELAAELGISLLFSSGEISFSAAKLMSLEEDNNNFSSTAPNAASYIKRHKISHESFSKKIAKIQNLKVLVIGDLIVDKYVFCDPIGMSQEDPTIVVKALQEKTFLGGAGIVAAHAAALGANSSFIGLAGDDDAAPYAKSCLKNYDVNAYLITDTTRPTTTKTRFRALNKTMLRVNQLREHDLVGLPLLETKKAIAKLAPSADVILFSDFSYGLLTQELIDFTLSKISRKNKFLAGDSQSSSQMGDLAKFVKMNLVAPTEREARLATNNKNSSLPELAKELRKKFQHDHIILTMGSEGVIVTSLAIEEFTDRLPALANTVIDVAGAGDSMFAASSLGLAAGMTIWEAALFGSIIAAKQVGQLGNSPIPIESINQRVKEIFGFQ